MTIQEHGSSILIMQMYSVGAKYVVKFAICYPYGAVKYLAQERLGTSCSNVFSQAAYSLVHQIGGFKKETFLLKRGRTLTSSSDESLFACFVLCRWCSRHRLVCTW